MYCIFACSVLIGCGKCEHEYDTGKITKEASCTEEGEKTFTCSICGETKSESVAKKSHIYKEEVTKDPTFEDEGEKTFTCENCGDSYIESISALDKELYNQNIYNQMIKFCDEGDYMSALITGRSALGSRGEAKTKVNEVTKTIFESQSEYIQEQIKKAIESRDYRVLDTLYYYKGLMYHVEFSDEQLAEYKYLSEIQGSYTYYESSDDGIQVEIRGYDIKIGEDKYTLNSSFGHSSIISFEKGYVTEIRSGLIAITYEDDTCIKYQSDAGKELEEKQEQEKEERRHVEEKERQEYLANEPKIGMTADEIKASNWGNPEKINKTTYAWGVTEQWCYPNYKYIYFEDGIVTAIQE